MNNNLVMAESNHEFLDSNLSFNEEEKDLLKNHLKDIITEMYPNKEHLNVRDVISVLKLFEEKKLLELNVDDELDDSLDMLVNQYNSELQEASIDEICSIILTFLPSNFKDVSLYDSELSFSSDVNVKVNANEVDETKEEFHVPTVDSNQNNNNIHVFNDPNNIINESNANVENNSINNNDSNNNNNKNNMKNNGTVSSNVSNDALIPSIVINSESIGISEFLPEDTEKDNSVLCTSNSDNTDNMEIIRLDKQSASALLSFSHLLDVESQSVMSLFDKKDSSKDGKDDNQTDTSSLKFDTDNTEKYFKELATMLRQNLIKSMANCQNLCNDLKLRDKTIKNLTSEIELLKKNFDENNKKLSRSEREVTLLKKRETQFMENIKEFSEKELEQKKIENNLKSKYNKLEMQYNTQQAELSKIHDTSQRHLSELKQKEEELKVALEEVDKAKDEKKIEEGKQAEMKKRLKDYEKQLKSIPIEIKEEILNNDMKWEQMLTEQKNIYEEQYEQLRDEIDKKTKQEEELVRRNNELLLQIDTLSCQINDLKAERELDMSLSQSLNGSTGMMKNLNVELTNALAMDQEKDRRIEENLEEINNLKEKCELLEKEIEIIKKEKQALIEEEEQWKTEKEENIILITEYLEPNLKKYMDNETILKNTIEELNNEVIDLKKNMNSKVQELLQKSKEEMQKEYDFDNQFNNIKSIALMVNNAVQTSDDMRDMISQLEKGIDDIDEINNELIEEKLKPPPEYHIEFDNHDFSIDQSELIIADENNLDSEVPVISCNISILDEDLEKMDKMDNKLEKITEEILKNNDNNYNIKNDNDDNDDIKNTNNDNDYIKIDNDDNDDIKNDNNDGDVIKNDNNNNDDIKNDRYNNDNIKNNSDDVIKNNNECNNNIRDDSNDNYNVSNIDNDDNDNNNGNENDNNEKDNDNSDDEKDNDNSDDEKDNDSNNDDINNSIISLNNDDKKEDILTNNKFDINNETKLLLDSNKNLSLINQEMNINVKDSLNPNIPLNKPLIANEEGEKNLDTKAITSAIPSSNKNMILIDRRKKDDTKTVLTFLFFQCVVIFATALSVVLTIEKMLGIRIIMKFVDTFLEEEHLIKDEGSPS